MPIDDKSDTNESAQKWSGRYLILLFDCTMVMGIYYCVGVPSALQSQLQRQQVNCSSTNEFQHKNCCSECLGLGPDKYNQLYAIFSLTNAVLVFPSGVFVDRFGNRVSSMIFTGFTLVGSVLFAMAVSFGIQGTRLMFVLMMAGRMLIGAGTGSSIIVQDRVVFVWFWDKLALAFGILTSTLRIGSVLNFLVTSRVSSEYGLSWALWLGAGMCFICFASAVIFSIIDKHGAKRFQLETKSSSSLTALMEIKTFPRSFWIVCIMIATYYSFLVPYIANGSKFLEDTHGYDRRKSTYINGILYEASILICPVVGKINEKWGLRIALATMGSLFTVLALLLMLFTDTNAIACYIVMGICYCMAVISLWPCIALTVPLKCVGTANGIAALMQYASVAVTSFGVGKLLGHIEGTTEEHRQWVYVLFILIGHLSVTVFCGVYLNIQGYKKGSSLNRPAVKFKTLGEKETEYLIQTPD